jgi:hypothetical protein
MKVTKLWQGLPDPVLFPVAKLRLMRRSPPVAHTPPLGGCIKSCATLDQDLGILSASRRRLAEQVAAPLTLSTSLTFLITVSHSPGLTSSCNVEWDRPSSVVSPHN